MPYDQKEDSRKGDSQGPSGFSARAQLLEPVAACCVTLDKVPDFLGVEISSSGKWG